MKLSLAVALFSFGVGLIFVATPQTGLALRMTSQELGVLGTGLALGYAAGCLLFGQVLRRYQCKHVLLGGVVIALLAAWGMARAQAVQTCVLAQLAFGVASGAFWPFASAWMLDFTREELGKTTILRFYNVAWTSGGAAGMCCAGLLCNKEGPATTFYLAGVVIILCGASALLVPASGGQAARGPGSAGFQPALGCGQAACSTNEGRQDACAPRRKIGAPLLIAAVLANLLVLATKAAVINNYPELNKYLNFQAGRMGLLTAAILAGQLFGFLIGALYEPFLGRRSMYACMAASLVLINLAVAYMLSLPVLVAAMLLCGMVAALAFQTAILAATEYFRLPRTGTTFHEAMVGVGGLGALAAGTIVEQAKAAGAAPLAALRAPFIVLAVTVAAALLLQLILVTRCARDRVLLSAVRG